MCVLFLILILHICNTLVIFVYLLKSMLLYLELEDYLAQWFIHDQGGAYPVRLIRGSVESGWLGIYLSVPPPDYRAEPPASGLLAIELPNFRHKDTRSCYWLAPRAAEGLRKIIRTRFDMEMWKELHRFDAIFRRQDDMIYAFLERHDIEATEKNFNAVKKRYQRKRDIYRRIKSRKK